MKLPDPKRYDALLRVRKIQEQGRSQVFAEVQRKIQGLRDQRKDLEKYQRNVLDRAGAEAGSQAGPNAAHMRALFQFERHLKKLNDEKGTEIDQHLVTAETRRAELEEAMKQRRIVEKLIENATRDMAYETNRREQRMHDDLASMLFARAQSAHELDESHHA